MTMLSFHGPLGLYWYRIISDSTRQAFIILVFGFSGVSLAGVIARPYTDIESLGSYELDRTNLTHQLDCVRQDILPEGHPPPL
ncbi:hypothetical protein NPIL_223301 [Nephila pilipes]|uniref:Uncharacterized protein n=1 Tax=Nephila pilipes TaxID=299642 RepID=A0A8X6MIA5_NEPPI|nr:hypothetical protein NPIL_223301 [Nephila pilipes]